MPRVVYEWEFGVQLITWWIIGPQLRFLWTGRLIWFKLCCVHLNTSHNNLMVISLPIHSHLTVRYGHPWDISHSSNRHVTVIIRSLRSLITFIANTPLTVTVDKRDNANNTKICFSKFLPKPYLVSKSTRIDIGILQYKYFCKTSSSPASTQHSPDWYF